MNFFNNYIIIHPFFGIEDHFSIKITNPIPSKILENFLIEEPYTDFFYPNIREQDGVYFLNFNRDGIINDAIHELAPWLENAYFFQFFQSSRYTFQTSLVEVKIENGFLKYREVDIQEEIPYSRLLGINSEGVQQSFHLPYELLVVKSELWKSDYTIRAYLLEEAKNNIIYTLEALKPSYEKRRDGEIYYGESFRINRYIEHIHLLGEQLEEKLIAQIYALQETDRMIIMDRLRKKINISNSDAVDEASFNTVFERLMITAPKTFKMIYTTLCNGRFGPYFGLLPLHQKSYSIYQLTVLLRTRSQIKFPDRLFPFAYLGKSTYACIDTSYSSFPVVNFYRKSHVVHWYDAYKQVCHSFEEWLNNWIHEIFREIYEC